jgi:hypothetical protein
MGILYPRDDALADLDRRIEGILEGLADDPLIPLAVRQVDRIRSAALAIIEANLPVAGEKEAFGRLLQVAKKCAIPAFAVAAIIEELALPDVRPVDIRSEATAARQLRRAGYSRCPSCARALLDELTLERAEAKEREWLATELRIAERRERVREAS